VRVATRENTYTLAELAALGSPSNQSGKSWGAVTVGGLRGGWPGRGFFHADWSTGELWVIAVLPEFEAAALARA